MAEIYRSRLASIEGAGRILVIKRIQAGFNSNSEFLQMFKSEIKVTMGFNHPNIVQLYDFGDEEGMPFIAMEYVDGKNARQFANMFEKQKQKLPVELAAYIIEQAAAGLHYAHSYRDKITGSPLNVVHRDISPQNILVSYEGTVKVIDFGIAKATTNDEATKAGIIKGKPSYLAPEQITGEDLDGRCDIFALGICLWELLVGRKLFQAPGENEYAVLKLIESCDTFVKPPSQFNPSVPKDLDMIVLRALAKKRDKRFQTAEEFQKAIKKFILTTYTEFNPSDLSSWAKHLFKDEIVEDRKDLQRLNAKAEQLLTLELEEDRPPASDGRDLKPLAPRKEEKTFESSDLELESPPSEAPQEAKPAAVAAPKPVKKIEMEKSPSLPKKFAATGSFAKVSAGASAGASPQRPQAAASKQKQRGHQNPADGDFETNRGSSFGGWIAAALLIAGLGGSGYYLFTKFQKDSRDLASENAIAQADPTEKPKATAAPVKPVTGKITLKLNITPSADGAKITLNEKPVDPANPVVQVRPDQPLEIYVEKKNFRPLRREFVVRSDELGELREWLIEVPLEPLHYGQVTIKSVPSSDASVYPIDSSTRSVASDRKPWAVLKTPIEMYKFPIGQYEVRLENKVLGMSKTVTVDIQENRIVTVDERLDVLHK